MQVDSATSLDRKSGVPGMMMVGFHCFPRRRNRTHFRVDYEETFLGISLCKWTTGAPYLSAHFAARCGNSRTSTI